MIIYSAASTRTMCATARIMPRMAGVSLRTTLLCRRVSPSPLIVSLCFCGRVVPLRSSVTLSLSAMAVPSRRVEIVHRPVAQARRLLRRAEHLERLHRRVDDVVRVSRSDALGEDVLDPRDFQHGADRAAGDDAGAGRRRAEEDAARAEHADH